MEYVHHTGQLHGVDPTIGIGVIIGDNLSDSGSGKSLEGFCVRMLFAELGCPECLSHNLADFLRKASQMSVTVTHKMQRFGIGSVVRNYTL